MLVEVYYQLYSNKIDYLMTFLMNWTFFDPNFYEIYDKTTNILQVILLILSSRKLANLPHP